LRYLSPDGSRLQSRNVWIDAKSDRRCELVDRQIAGTLTPVEATELADLRQQILRYRDRVAPLPLDHARTLYRELLTRARASDTGA
jgi:hypothetical protein